MPRKANPRNRKEQARVAEWRDREARKGAPETSGRPAASHVDIALAAAATGFIQAADESGKPGPARVSKAMMEAAIDFLTTPSKRGRKPFDRKEAVRKLLDRLKRHDLYHVCEIARIEDRLRALSEREAGK